MAVSVNGRMAAGFPQLLAPPAPVLTDAALRPRDLDPHPTMQAASKIARSSVRAAQAQRGSAAAAGRALSSKTGHAASDGTFRAYNL